MRTLLSLFATLLLSFGAYAATIEKPMPDAAQEARARALFVELKCVVCEGQSLADSDATLARQMRERIREQLAEGKTDAEIVTFFRIAYGDRILMKPPVETTTMPLWLTPILLLVIGGWIVRRNTQKGAA